MLNSTVLGGQHCSQRRRVRKECAGHRRGIITTPGERGSGTDKGQGWCGGVKRAQDGHHSCAGCYVRSSRQVSKCLLAAERRRMRAWETEGSSSGLLHLSTQQGRQRASSNNHRPREVLPKARQPWNTTSRHVIDKKILLAWWVRNVQSRRLRIAIPPQADTRQRRGSLTWQALQNWLPAVACLDGNLAQHAHHPSLARP